MPKKQISEHEKVVSLHRYYAWSTVLRNQFREPFKEIIDSDKPEQGITDWMGPFGLGKGPIFMSYWYAALCVVVEGWKQLSLRDSAIDKLIRSENTERLKKHRNATCHYQPGMTDRKWNEFEKTAGTVDWVLQLDKEFSRYFLDQTKVFAKQFLEASRKQR